MTSTSSTNVSVSRKQEQDDLQKLCQQEVEDLHHIFVDWFLGKNPKDKLTASLDVRLMPNFSHVAPNGRFLRGRNNLISHLEDKYGCYEGRLFTIDIYAVRLVWTDVTHTKFLCMYEEWQSWEQDEDIVPGIGTGTGNGANGNGNGTTRGTPEVNQFGRLSSCLLEKNPEDGIMRWVHVHETWLEDEAPESPAGQMRRASWTDLSNDENILKGPKEDEVETLTAVTLSKPSTGAALKNVPESTEKRLLLLISSHPHSKDQVESQELAYAVLDIQQIPYDVLDGADPAVRQERNELFKTSRVWGKYPQFFLMGGSESDGGSSSDCKAVFWGDPVRFQKSVDNGTLKQDLGLVEGGGDSGTDVPVGATSAAVAAVPVVAAPHANVGGAKADAEDSAGPQGRLLVLVSMQSLSADQAAYQQKAMTALQKECIPYVTVDGSDPDPVCRNKRNDLFKLSQSWGKYPQFFTVDGAGKNSYWGDRDRFEACTEKGTLKEDLGVVGGGFSHEDNNDDDTVAPIEQATSLPAPPTKTASDSEAHILVMLSSMTYKKEVVGYEEEAVATLYALGIPYDTVDSNGSDVALGDRRKELFKISQSAGDNPQFFRVEEDGRTNYCGGWNRFKPAMDNGLLGQKLGFVTSEKPTQVEQPAADGAEKSSDLASAAAVGGAAAAGAVAGATVSRELSKSASSSSKVSFVENPEDDEPERLDDGLEIEPDDEEAREPEEDPQEVAFLNASNGILVFEEEDEEEDEEDSSEEDEEDDDADETYPETPTKQLIKPEGVAASPIPQDISKKRHISPKLEKYAKPLTWENTLVGISIAGFDIGTSQGPMGDESWYHEMGGALEQMAQSRAASRSRRKLVLPEMVFPTAHVAIEGHGIWLSWDVTDALEEWAKAHREIALHSSVSNNGVQVLKVKDAKLWEKKQSKIKLDPNTPSRFHYDWSYSTPFCGKLEGGRWLELDESGMRLELLTDQSVPILFFDEVILFEDDLHDNGQAEFSIKLRVMPSCAFILARYWLRVDDVVVRVRETRVLIDFFGMKPTFYRDVTWRECWWDDLRGKGLPTDIKSWTYEGRETPEWAALLKSIPEAKLPDGICKYAVLEHGETNGGNEESGMMEL